MLAPSALVAPKPSGPAQASAADSATRLVSSYRLELGPSKSSEAALPPHPPPAHSFRRPITLPVLPRAPAPVYLRGGVLGMPRAEGPTSHPLTFWANCNELFVSMWCSADDETLTNMSVFDLPRSEFESRWVSRELR